MAHCYVELNDGKAESVLAQDKTGIYAGGLVDNGLFAFGLYREPRKTWVKLPEWEDARLALTTDWISFGGVSEEPIRRPNLPRSSKFLVLRRK